MTQQEPAERLIGNTCDTVGSPPSPTATHFLRKRDGPSAGCGDVRQINSAEAPLRAGRDGPSSLRNSCACKPEQMRAGDQPSALPLGWVVGDPSGLGTTRWRGAALVESFRKRGNGSFGSGLAFCFAGRFIPLFPSSFVLLRHVVLNNLQSRRHRCDGVDFRLFGGSDFGFGTLIFIAEFCRKGEK